MYARILTTCLMLMSAVAMAPDAAAAPPCDRRVNNTPHKIAECVRLDRVRAHQAAFQTIADQNGGHRMSSTPGHDDSIAYVVALMDAAGYDVSLQPVEYPTFISLTPSLLEQVSPPPAGPIQNRIMAYSGSADVTAPVTHLAGPPGDLTPGCEAADFAGFPAGNIALVSRTACTFALKATNAYNAGASGLVIYNNVPGGPIAGTLGNGFTLDLPVTAVSDTVGQQLTATPDLVLRLSTETFRGLVTAYNVLAETTTGDPDQVVLVGAHLDSVIDGPGIQDNGSGSAAILEAALQMARVKPDYKVRFAWWAAHEAGLVGSNYYVDSLSDEDRARIALYLNFDTIGSPNFVRFVYDGDGSTFGVAGPAGSAAIEEFFEDFYARRGLAFEATEINDLSDYAAFSTYDIPFGGIFTGATGIKTAEQAATYGGTAGEQYDPCYHLACDTFDNVSLQVLDQNADAAAAAIIHFAVIPDVD